MFDAVFSAPGFCRQAGLAHRLPQVLQPGVLHQAGLVPQGGVPGAGGQCQGWLSATASCHMMHLLPAVLCVIASCDSRPLRPFPCSYSGYPKLVDSDWFFVWVCGFIDVSSSFK